MTGLAMPVSALGASVIHFQPESLPALKVQLAHHEVHALTFHPASATGHIHVSLNGGRHMTVIYPVSEQAALLALARADATPAALASPKPKAATPAHHKLRYIAAGILVLVVIVVAAVLLIDRRRRQGAGAGDGVAESAPADASPGDPA
jgi:hypothetical protein